MATFTTEEIELLKNKGNDYCKRVWLGLYDGTPHNDPREEQTIRDFMVDKYERKRYYIDPQNVIKNGHISTTKINENNKNSVVINQQKKNVDLQQQNNKLVDFVADFSSADIFNGINNNSVNNESNNSLQTSFANFDNNPVFNSTSKYY